MRLVDVTATNFIHWLAGAVRLVDVLAPDIVDRLAGAVGFVDFLSVEACVAHRQTPPILSAPRWSYKGGYHTYGVPLRLVPGSERRRPARSDQWRTHPFAWRDSIT